MLDGAEPAPLRNIGCRSCLLWLQARTWRVAQRHAVTKALPDIQPYLSAGKEQQRMKYRRSDTCRLKRLGDGNCFWRALGYRRWKAVKKIIQKAVERGEVCLTVSQQSQMQAALLKNHWNINTALKVVAAYLRVRFVVYIQQLRAKRWIPAYIVNGSDDPQRQIELAFAAGHYDRL